MNVPSTPFKPPVGAPSKVPLSRAALATQRDEVGRCETPHYKGFAPGMAQRGAGTPGFRMCVTALLAGLLAMPALLAADAGRSAVPQPHETTVEERSVEAAGIDVSVEIHTPAEPPRARIVWSPSEHGIQPGHQEQARALAARGVEVWLVDFLQAAFLPAIASSFDAIDEATLVALLEIAAQTPSTAASGAAPPDVFVMTHDRAAPWTLAAIARWQSETASPGAVRGIVLMSPYLHLGVPELHDDVEFQPIVDTTNLPVYLLQPDLAPGRPLLMPLRARLAAGGSAVAVRRLPEVRDRFFFRDPPLPEEAAARRVLPDEIAFGIDLLARIPAVTEPAVRRDDRPLRLATPTRQERLLDPIAQPVDAPPLAGTTPAGEAVDLRDLAGDVVLVNFWASWCPPCVHEMPSMQRLEDRLGDRGFRILAHNLGEPVEIVQPFLDQLEIGFLVTLDPEQDALADWRILAYPSSYLVDRDGQLRARLFGAIDWDDERAVRQIETLLDESKS